MDTEHILEKMEQLFISHHSNDEDFSLEIFIEIGKSLKTKMRETTEHYKNWDKLQELRLDKKKELAFLLCSTYESISEIIYDLRKYLYGSDGYYKHYLSYCVYKRSAYRKSDKLIWQWRDDEELSFADQMNDNLKYMYGKSQRPRPRLP